MIWFFAFTSVGMSILITLLLIRQTLRLNWRHWFSGLATMGILAWLSFGTPLPRKLAAGSRTPGA